MKTRTTTQGPLDMHNGGGVLKGGEKCGTSSSTRAYVERKIGRNHVAA